MVTVTGTFSLSNQNILPSSERESTGCAVPELGNGVADVEGLVIEIGYFKAPRLKHPVCRQ
jgi:hypothetical protein